jgi:hypothetical protein
MDQREGLGDNQTTYEDSGEASEEDEDIDTESDMDEGVGVSGADVDVIGSDVVRSVVDDCKVVGARVIDDVKDIQELLSEF